MPSFCWPLGRGPNPAMTRALTGQRNDGGAPSAAFTAPVVAAGVSLAGVTTAALWVGSLLTTACLTGLPVGVFGTTATAFGAGAPSGFASATLVVSLCCTLAAQTGDDDLVADMERGLRLHVVRLGELDQRLLVDARNLAQRLARRHDVDAQTVVRQYLGRVSRPRPMGQCRCGNRGRRTPDCSAGSPGAGPDRWPGRRRDCSPARSPSSARHSGGR